MGRQIKKEKVTTESGRQRKMEEIKIGGDGEGHTKQSGLYVCLIVVHLVVRCLVISG